MKITIILTEEILNHNPKLKEKGRKPGDTIVVTLDDEGDRPPTPPHNG